MRVLRFFIGLLLVPLCVAGTQTLVSLVMGIDTGDQAVPYPLLALVSGFLLWQMIFIFLPRPVRTYVFAHELTHALWGWLMGARVSKFKVSKDKGSVTLSKTNFLITLAPYFFPLYTVLLIALYYILVIFWEVEKYHLIWLGFIGFTWGFHLSFTVITLMQQQSDIRSCGYLFSYAFIYLMNVLGICIWVVIVSEASMVEMGKFLYNDTVNTGLVVRDGILKISSGFKQ